MSTDTPTLAEMTDRAQRIALEYYAAGLDHGIELGRAQYLAEDARAWENMRHVIRAAATTPDLAELRRRRGQHDRAEATEALWADRGIA